MQCHTECPQNDLFFDIFPVIKLLHLYIIKNMFSCYMTGSIKLQEGSFLDFHQSIRCQSSPLHRWTMIETSMVPYNIHQLGQIRQTVFIFQSWEKVPETPSIFQEPTCKSYFNSVLTVSYISVLKVVNHWSKEQDYLSWNLVLCPYHQCQSQ